MTVSFKDLEKVCASLGLTKTRSKKGCIWKGFINGKYVRVSVHDKAGGRDIPDGTFRKYVRKLGFESAQDFLNYFKGL